jgi:geranylgeranylglycerol-phosphate geranylgeranyltransferase
MQLGQRVRPYVTLIRLPYVFALDLACVFFIVTFQKGFYKPGLTVFAVITVTLVTAGSAAVNDYCDRDSDALTHPERPIPANRISPTHAALFSVLAFLAGLGISFMINLVAFGIVALNVVLFILYPRVIKRLSGFLGNLVMGYLGATIALFAGAVVFQTINVASLSFVGLIAGGAIGVNVLKDVLTLEGDAKAGYPTLAVTRGVRVAATVGPLFLLLSVITSPLPFFVDVVSVVYLFPIALWGTVVVVTVLPLLKAPTGQNVKKSLHAFNTSFPYLVGFACAVYLLPYVLRV